MWQCTQCVCIYGIVQGACGEIEANRCWSQVWTHSHYCISGNKCASLWPFLVVGRQTVIFALGQTDFIFVLGNSQAQHLCREYPPTSPSPRAPPVHTHASDLTHTVSQGIVQEMPPCNLAIFCMYQQQTEHQNAARYISLHAAQTTGERGLFLHIMRVTKSASPTLYIQKYYFILVSVLVLVLILY